MWFCSSWLRVTVRDSELSSDHITDWYQIQDNSDSQLGSSIGEPHLRVTFCPAYHPVIMDGIS